MRIAKKRGPKFTPNDAIHFDCGITAIILERRNEAQLEAA